MAFVRQKVSRGRVAFYLVENRRQRGKVRQRVLAYLGPCGTLLEAVAYFEQEAARLTAQALRFEEKAAEMKAKLVQDADRAVTKRPSLLTYPSLSSLFNSLKNNTVPRPKRRASGFRWSGTWDAQCARYWDKLDCAAKFREREDSSDRRVKLLQSLQERAADRATSCSTYRRTKP